MNKFRGFVPANRRYPVAHHAPTLKRPQTRDSCLFVRVISANPEADCVGLHQGSYPVPPSHDGRATIASLTYQAALRQVSLAELDYSMRADCSGTHCLTTGLLELNEQSNLVSTLNRSLNGGSSPLINQGASPPLAKGFW